MTDGSSGYSALALVGQVARVLNSGLAPDETLRVCVATMQRGLAAKRVMVWRRRARGSSFAGVTPHTGEHEAVSLDELPAPTAGVRRYPLVHGGGRLGVLELELESPEALPDASLLQILCDLLAPFLDAMTVSEDLALEVADRSREIEEQRRFTSLIIDSLPVGLYVIDRDYRIQVWNRKRETGTQGLRRSEVMGRQVFDVLTRQPAAQLRAEFDRVFRAGEVQQMEVELEGPEQTSYYRISRIPMRLDADVITHVITIGEDVTESREVQLRILQSEKLAAVGQLAAGVMHEINNPLATIGACVAAIEARLGESADSTVREYLEIIDKEVDRCTRIVDGLLDFSRPKESAPKRPADANALVERTLFLLKHHQRFRRINVARELTSGLPPVLVNDEQMIQVLMALMLNGVDAMEDGGVLTVRSRPHSQRSDEVLIEVADTGHGIPAADLQKIFEPFYTTKPPGRGTGLGLSICYGIVEQHMGRLEVESLPGFGSTFRVYLPVAIGG
ncbi:MAG TPA: ATP-binding protein [Gemmatimonadales bacterium]|jgi:two-component system NtrC family sensor kinase|nr:ATP-binding protein [Gemmatimonadales bacterium]